MTVNKQFYISMTSCLISFESVSVPDKNCKQDVSVFFFDKRWADKLLKGTKRREVVVDILRAGVHQLQRLQHPRLLTIVHGLEETTDTMAFATEPVLGSLANIMGCLEDRLRQGIPSSLREYTFTEFEHTYGLLQVSYCIL